MLKFIAFDRDDQGWKLSVEGTHPDDLYELINRIPGIGKAFYPHRSYRCAGQGRVEYKVAIPAAPTPHDLPKEEKAPEPEDTGNRGTLNAVTPDGEIYSLQDVRKDPKARGNGMAIFWVDPDTGDLSRCKGPKYTGWPEPNRVVAEERFRAWAEEKGYEVSVLSPRGGDV